MRVSIVRPLADELDRALKSVNDRSGCCMSSIVSIKDLGKFQKES